MLVAYVNKHSKTGIIFGAYVSQNQAKKIRKVAEDEEQYCLVFNDDGSINQEDWWLFPWELIEADCYAKKTQQSKLNIKGWNLSPVWRETK